MRERKFKLLTIFSLGLATLLLSSCAPATDIAATSETKSQITQSPDASENASEAILTAEPETNSSKSPTASEEATNTASEKATNPAGEYISYESFAASSNKYSDSKVVLFFNAVWCSTCKQARSNFESSLEEIPKNLTIVVVDFDNSIELRKKYGVSVQHTFIEINKAGEAVSKWSGSVTVAGIVEQLS